MITLATILILGSAGSLPLERVSSAYCETDRFDVALPCVPVACRATACEDFVEVEGGLLCLDSDEVFPAGHYVLTDAQEDDPANGPELAATVEY